MNKHHITKAAAIFLMIALLVTAFALPALASTGTKIAELTYRDLKLMVNGTYVTPTDATGLAVEPFIIDGTTYLPVRAVGNALGLDVAWTAETNTVFLISPAPETIPSDAVWISRTDTRYHNDSSCNGVTYWPVPLSSATGMGLVICDTCVWG